MNAPLAGTESAVDDEGLGGAPLPEPHECDLVMKGGITSGVVYPPAIARLSRRYRFRSIGGASAGAIAAGAAAAAEYGRRSGKRPDAFGELAGLSDEVAGGLSQLFVPSERGKPLFGVFMYLLGRANGPEGGRGPIAGALHLVGTVSGVLMRLALAWPLTTLVGLLPAIGIAGLGWQFGGGAPEYVQVVIGMVVMVLALGFGGLALALRVKQAATKDLAAENFGLCSGMGRGRAEARGGLPPLTRWLHAKFQSLSGLGDAEVLTFGHLYDPQGRGEHDRSRPDVELRVMTTSLSQGRPFQMPFAQDIFFWREDDFRQLFPAAVVDAMKAADPDGGRHGWYRFPRAEELPVLVPIRMSLSFPFLLWAVPLYAVDYTEARDAEGRRPFRRVWFSDGGLCSNFPIHFFDSPWPTRPTFGINLVAARGKAAESERPEDRVDLPEQAGDGIAKPFRPFGTMGGFIGAMIDTMKDWRDTVQTSMPGYRERVVEVALNEKEGGLNLDMPPELVRTLAGYGAHAGESLDGFDFSAHRWRRHLVWLGQLQRTLAQGRSRYGDPSVPAQDAAPLGTGSLPLRAFLERYGPVASQYKHDAGRREKALSNLDGLMQLADDWEDILCERADRGRMRAPNFPHPAMDLQQVPSERLPALAED